MLVVTLAVYILDRLTKLYIVENLGLGQSIPVIDGWFDIVYVRNTGAAFGFMAYVRDSFRIPFFMLTTIAALCMLGWFAWKTDPCEKLMPLALSMIIGGALGNMTDRIYYRYVVDFIDWHIGALHWPAFNIADSGITVGVVLLGIDVILRGRETSPAPGI